MLKIENVLKCSNPLMHKIEVVVVMDNLFGRHICTVMKLKLEKHIKQQRGGIYNIMQRQLFDKIEIAICSYIYFSREDITHSGRPDDLIYSGCNNLI